tara:strand:- start:678 stop:1445 length:768 start_codon:yes stop_codon:yes gene_type:complete
VEPEELNELDRYREEPNKGYRTDPFKKDHKGKVLLFLGDSFTFGEGLSREDTWAYKTYRKIQHTEEPVSGFYNLGMSGTSIHDSVSKFFWYCEEYGNPDVAFFMTTEIDRDLKHTEEVNLNSFVYDSYSRLEDYCVSNNIKLYSFSWVKNVDPYSPEPKRYLFKLIDGLKVKRPLWIEQAKRQYDMYKTNLLEQFSTFYDYPKELLVARVHEFDEATANKEKSLWALDKVHPGTAFHDFYSEFIYDKYVVDNHCH